MKISKKTVKMCLLALTLHTCFFSDGFAQDDLEALEGMAESLHLERAKVDVIEGAVQEAREADVDVKIKIQDAGARPHTYKEMLNEEVAGGTPARRVETVPEGMTQDAFTELLKTKYLGSYIFYTKLTDQERQQVFDEYVATRDMGEIRKKISSLLNN